MFNENKAAEFLASGYFSQEQLCLLDDDRIRPNREGGASADLETTRLFQAGQPGRKLLMQLVGRLIGNLDIIVMDEAHKSREEGE